MHAGQSQAASSLIHLLLSDNSRARLVTIINIKNKEKKMQAEQAQAASSLIHLLLSDNSTARLITIINIKKIKKMQAEAILNAFRYSMCVEKAVCN